MGYVFSLIILGHLFGNIFFIGRHSIRLLIRKWRISSRLKKAKMTMKRRKAQDEESMGNVAKKTYVSGRHRQIPCRHKGT